MLKWEGGGGGTNSFGSVLTWELEVSAILKRGARSFHHLKGWAQKVFPFS